MIVDYLDAVGGVLQPAKLSPRLRDLISDARRQKVHLFKLDGCWLFDAPHNSRDDHVLLAGLYCVKRNER